MVAEIISVGTELLLGMVANTNAQYLAGRLAELGFDLCCQTVVGDDAGQIRTRLEDAYKNGAELVILAGVVGPGKDDRTKEMLASYFGRQPEFDAKAFEQIEKRLRALGVKDLTEEHRRQAVIPADSMVLTNEFGTEPGFVLEQDGRIAVVLPGQPKELQDMFEQCVNRYLHNLVDRSQVTVAVRLKTAQEALAERVSEAAVTARLGELLLLENPHVEVSAQEGNVLIRITAAAPTRGDASLMSNIIAQNCIQVLGEDIIKEVKEEKETKK